MLGSRIRAALGAASITLLALALVAPAGAAAKDGGKGKHHGHTRKAAMQVCKKGGWKTVEKEDGSRFKNQGRCVSYQVRGGHVTTMEPGLTVTAAASADLLTCEVTVAVKDLDVNTEYSVDYTVDGTAAVPGEIKTDASGEGSTVLTGIELGLQVVVTVDGRTADPVVCPAPEPDPIDPI
jgi:hypothetical protein